MADYDVVKRWFVEVPEIHSFLGIKSDPESCRAGSSSTKAGPIAWIALSVWCPFNRRIVHRTTEWLYEWRDNKRSSSNRTDSCITTTMPSTHNSTLWLNVDSLLLVHWMCFGRISQWLLLLRTIVPFPSFTPTVPATKTGPGSRGVGLSHCNYKVWTPPSAVHIIKAIHVHWLIWPPPASTRPLLIELQIFQWADIPCYYISTTPLYIFPCRTTLEWSSRVCLAPYFPAAKCCCCSRRFLVQYVQRSTKWYFHSPHLLPYTLSSLPWPFRGE